MIPICQCPLKERRRAYDRLNGSEQEIADAESRQDIRIFPMGSGSDYTPFLQHLGIASAHLLLAGEGQDGSYHTLYDTYEHYMKYRDPGLVYGAALSKVSARATLRLANAERLPFEFLNFADNIALYVQEPRRAREFDARRNGLPERTN